VNEFAKAKVLSALAVVGVLFAIHPLVQDYGEAGFGFFGVVLEFRVIYYLLLVLLGSAVYFFAMDFIADNPLGFAHRMGNHFYAMAMLFPPTFFFVLVAAKAAEGVVWVSDSPVAGEISKIAISILIGAGAILIAHVVSRRMNLRDRFASLDQMSFRAKEHLQRAEELQEAGHHDLVALEAFRSVESALRRALLDGDIHVSSSRPNQLIPVAARAGVIPENLVGVFHELRVARNRAVHASDDFSEADALWFIETTRKMLASIQRVKEDAGAMAEKPGVAA